MLIAALLQVPSLTPVAARKRHWHLVRLASKEARLLACRCLQGGCTRSPLANRQPDVLPRNARIPPAVDVLERVLDADLTVGQAESLYAYTHRQS